MRMLDGDKHYGETKVGKRERVSEVGGRQLVTLNMVVLETPL